MDSIDSAISTTLAAHNAATQQQIAYALLAKSQEMVKVQAQAATNLLQAAANMGKALGKGQQFDAVA
jgi:hypothetical protein